MNGLDNRVCRFTWFGPSNKKSRLDRVLINHCWLDKGQWFITLFHRKNSDHKPVISCVTNPNWGPKPFKFFDWWLQEPGLKEVIHNCWKAATPGNLHVKLRTVKLAIKSWNLQHIGNLDHRIKQLELKQSVADDENWSHLVKEKLSEELRRLYEARFRVLSKDQDLIGVVLVTEIHDFSTKLLLGAGRGIKF